MYLQDLIQRLTELNIVAAKNQIKQKEKSKLYYDKKVHNINLQIGDMVYALKEPKAGKLDRYRKEPLRVIELYGKNAVLEAPSGKRIYKHLNKLWPVDPNKHMSTQNTCYVLNLLDIIPTI